MAYRSDRPEKALEGRHIHTLLDEHKRMCEEARIGLKETFSEYLCLHGMKLTDGLGKLLFLVNSFGHKGFSERSLETFGLLNGSDLHCDSCAHSGNCPHESGKREHLKSKAAMTADEAARLVQIRNRRPGGFRTKLDRLLRRISRR